MNNRKMLSFVGFEVVLLMGISGEDYFVAATLVLLNLVFFILIYFDF